MDEDSVHYHSCPRHDSGSEDCVGEQLPKVNGDAYPVAGSYNLLMAVDV